MVEFSPTTNPFAPFLQRILVSPPSIPDVSPFQPIVSTRFIVYYGNFDLFKVSFLLHVRYSLELVYHVMYYLDHPAVPLLPGGILLSYLFIPFLNYIDIVIIPRSSNLLRMIYRNAYGIDFRISSAGIHMEDAGEVFI